MSSEEVHTPDPAPTARPEHLDAVPADAANWRTIQSLTFDWFSTVNAIRCAKWHDGRFGHSSWVGDGKDWTGADWSNAMQGEAGEAGNVVKKLRRIETSAHWANPVAYDELRDKLADEIADTFIYLDLLASYYNIDFPSAIIRKFNAISDREGFEEKL